MLTKIMSTVVFGMFISVASCTAQSNDQGPSKDQNHKPPTFAKLLKDLDVNKDGKLAKAEVKGPLQKDFVRVDTNKDGYITEAELKKAGPPKPPKGRNPE